jgi:Domain of unknown function (DUF4159)/Aerotolerance regulator N-terminal
MLALGSFAFAAPWLLVALAGLPAIWWLLRVTPPAPRRVPFPAIRLLFGLRPREETPAKTPWWLILLRTIVAALVIVALAQPLLHPQARLAGSGPLVLVVDNGWAAAHDWDERRDAALDLLAEAQREGRHVILVTTAPLASGEPAPPLAPIRAADARAAVEALQPQPWPDDRKTALARLKAMPLPRGSTIVWFSDGVDDGAAAALADYLSDRGSVRYVAAPAADAPRLIAADAGPGGLAGQEIAVVVQTLPAPLPRRIMVRASAEDGALLARTAATIAAGASSVRVPLPMPTELRNRIAQIAIEGEGSAGGVLLVDERWRRRPVGIAAPSANPSSQPLLSADYYLQRALSPFTEVRRGPALALMKRDLAVLIYADSGPDSPGEAATVRKWIENGGLLLRFAGPLLTTQDDHLLPVRLRSGGRTIGGALSWEKPAHLAPFAADSPFAGLAIPDDVTVSRQVLAEPDLDLAQRTWARLADGTPLVTAKKLGKGWIVLVHTTADTDWSNLAISGLFVQMLRRIVAMSEGVSGTTEAMLPPLETLDGFGRIERAPPAAHAISGKEIATALPSPHHPPGFYGKADARRALNLSPAIGELKPISDLPAGVVRDTFAHKSTEVDFRPALLAAAFVLLLIDLVIALGLRGLLWRRAAGVAAPLTLALLVVAPAAHADDAFVIKATSGVHLAYVETGDPQVDAISRAGLNGLTAVLNQRTAVDTAAPMGVDVESDQLILFPLLYWPVTATQKPPSPAAAARINRYLETGGTIVFDTQNGGDETPGPFGDAAASQARLRRLLKGVKIPPLEPLPPNHVLTKSFYLLHDFPGRWDTGQVWIEPVADHVNDGVAGIIVGNNDWAGAWAIDDEGRATFPCVPGGERQREMAYRFGVNLVMYVLTGNYKNDQVHVPAILERLGQ